MHLVYFSLIILWITIIATGGNNYLPGNQKGQFLYLVRNTIMKPFSSAGRLIIIGDRDYMAQIHCRHAGMHHLKCRYICIITYTYVLYIFYYISILYPLSISYPGNQQEGMIFSWTAGSQCHWGVSTYITTVCFNRPAAIHGNTMQYHLNV